MYEKVKRLLIDQMGLDANSISPNAKLIADLKLNSLELAEFILTCEEEFEIVIQDEDLKKMVCVKDIADYIENKIK